jgi:hypothetical protein
VQPFWNIRTLLTSESAGLLASSLVTSPSSSSLRQPLRLQKSRSTKPSSSSTRRRWRQLPTCRFQTRRIPICKCVHQSGLYSSALPAPLIDVSAGSQDKELHGGRGGGTGPGDFGFTTESQLSERCTLDSLTYFRKHPIM